MSSIRHIAHTRPLDVTLTGEIPPGTWRYSSRLALVLSGGGARGAYQVGVLAGLAERLPGLAFPILTGASVGAVNTMFLAAHPDPLAAAVAKLVDEWRQLTSDQVYQPRSGRLIGSIMRWGWRRMSGRDSGPAVVRGLVDTSPLRAFLERCIDLEGIGLRLAQGTLRAVALSTVSYATGRSVTFVQGGAPVAPWQRTDRSATMATLSFDHVMASAAVPILFPAVRMGDAFYGDGNVGALAPFSPAIHLGARAIVAIGTRSIGPAPSPASPAYPSTAQVMGLLFRAIFLDALEADAERLERMNRMLAALPPGTPAPDGLRPVELLLVRPSRSLNEIARGRDRLLPPAVRRVIRAIGGGREAGSDFLAYLLFHPEYTTPLIELGYDDVGTQWPAVERFFEKLERRSSVA